VRDRTRHIQASAAFLAMAVAAAVVSGPAANSQRVGSPRRRLEAARVIVPLLYLRVAPPCLRCKCKNEVVG
jgi:hypothetical protein